MHLLQKLIDVLPLALLSAGVILLFNGVLQAVIVISNPEAQIAFDLGILASAPLMIEPADLWPWSLTGGAILFLAGMVRQG
jgi:hypothetical protein